MILHYLSLLTQCISIRILQAKNRDFFSQYITEDFNTYLNRKRHENAHGNHIEMQAISELYNRPVEVFQYSIGNHFICQISREHGTPKLKTELFINKSLLI